MGIIKWETVGQKLVKCKIAKINYRKSITKYTVFCGFKAKYGVFQTVSRPK